MPILFTQNSPVIGIWKIEEPWQELLESLQKNEDSRQGALNHVCSIKSDKRKQEWLAVRVLLTHLAGNDAYIDYHENGAPVLKNSPYNISISHTTGFAAVILSNDESPGIDIEYHSGRAWKLREKYLGEKEREMFDTLHDNVRVSNEKLSEQAKLATICWCAKETAYKALRQTEVDFIDHMHILPFTLSGEGALSLKETKTSLQQTFKINYQITKEYIFTWKE